MKRKRLDRDAWTSIQKKRYIQKNLDCPEFRGTGAVLCLDEVDPPSRWEFPEGTVAVSESGMKWLELLPEPGDWLLTAMLDRTGRIVLWYVDMIAGWGREEDGVLYFDDLYLDLILRPNGEANVDDRDELDEALASGDIDGTLYRRALETADALLSGLLADPGALAEFCYAMLEKIEHPARAGARMLCGFGDQ